MAILKDILSETLQPVLVFVITAATSPAIPANAILDRAGKPILDRNGNYVVTRS